ncbi:MAG: hypothetical protein LUQ36_07320, partial [Methanoregula sp.]|nr:hypothetical protein [Methanoregula sp.]
LQSSIFLPPGNAIEKLHDAFHKIRPVAPILSDIRGRYTLQNGRISRVTSANFRKRGRPGLCEGRIPTDLVKQRLHLLPGT